MSRTLGTLLTTSLLAAVVVAIQGGEPVPKGTYKYAASLLNDGEYLCGAALLSRTSLVTAAICVAGKNPEDLCVLFDQVDAGEQSSQTNRCSQFAPDGALIFPVKSLATHPAFNSTGHVDNDIGVISLVSPVPGLVPNVCLGTSPGAQVGSSVRVIGKGATSGSNEGTSSVLKQLDQTVITEENCNAAYAPAVGITDPTSQFCAQSAQQPSDACAGDSGNAVLQRQNGRYSLIGVISETPPNCGDNSQPNIYSSVAPARGFLRANVVGSTAPCPPI